MYARCGLVCAASILAFLPLEAIGQDCVEDVPVLYVSCLKGNLGRAVPIYLKSDAPGNYARHDWGSRVQYLHYISEPVICDSGKTNCSGDDYSYNAITINHNWFFNDEDPLEQPITWTKDDNEAYWDDVYGIGDPGSTYFKIEPALMDYSQNCHGYAFDVGNWPFDHDAGADIILNTPDCYQKVVSSPLADVASRGDHSIKILDLEECNVGGGVLMWLVMETREKFRESPVYAQSSTCGDGGVTLGDPLDPGEEVFSHYQEN